MAKKVFLSAGHGGSDPGAVAYGLKEKNINLQILLACKAELERHGVKVVCSRTKDENDPVSQEVKEANASKADIAVSFHTNAGKGDGSETFYYTGSTNGKKLATLCEKYTKALGQNSRGVKSTKSLMFVRATDMTAVLCECAFIDHNKDNDIIDTVAEQKKFGIAYAKAILEYLGIDYKESATNDSFLVQITANILNVRAGAGTAYKVNTTVKKGYKYTIVQVKGDWGKLKSGAGWINLKYTKRV